MMYNSTPHSVTGKSPSELFFRRKFRDKIPSVLDIENQDKDSETRDKDKIQKEKGKNYSDLKRRTTENTILKGDKVYIENMIKGNKLTPNFNPTPHTVMERKGNEYKVKNDETGQEYRRNIVHLKKVEEEWKICREKEMENNTTSEEEKKKRTAKGKKGERERESIM